MGYPETIAAAAVVLALYWLTGFYSYILGGEITTMRGMIETLGGIVDRTPPRLNMPVTVLRISRPIGPPG